ncbi:MAG TPA: hypothetical protein VMA98_04500 [Candidatus Acidoferrales bacterium]|nr:hypothetical protein [Candidatus Acidoferrales bacterium]
MLRRFLAVVALVACIGVTAGTASAQGYGPRHAPPPPRYERHGRAPGRGYVWIGGYQHWNGRAYVWVPGRWARPPRPGQRWYPGRYVSRGGIYVWINGYWHF